MFGETLKLGNLGYLECAADGGMFGYPVHSSRTATPQSEHGNVCGGTLKLSSSDGLIKSPIKGAADCKNELQRRIDKGYAQEAPAIRPLEWTHAPVREVQRDGNMRYQVSKPALPRNAPDGKVHLVSTTRLEPENPEKFVSTRNLCRESSRASSSSRPSSRQASRTAAQRMEKAGAEALVVSAADFRRCGNSLTLMRGCQLEKLAPKPKEEVVAKSEFELSFKSAFVKRCRSTDQVIEDPWRNCDNPEVHRRVAEGDLILNQVWVDQPNINASEQRDKHWVESKKIEEEIDEEEKNADATLLPKDSARSMVSTAASSADGSEEVSSWKLPRSRTRESVSGGGRSSSRQPPAAHRRSQSTGAISQWRAGSVTEPSPPREARQRRESRHHSTSHVSGCPKPASRSAPSSADSKPGSGRDSSMRKAKKPKEYESRDPLLIDYSQEGPEVEERGSLAVRKACPMQRRFIQDLAEAEMNTKPLALWLSLDPSTGQVSLYPKDAATRLEGAYVNNRKNVPLAGLGNGLDDGIVHFGAKGSDEHAHPVQKCASFGTCINSDVRRLQVPANAEEICINVTQDPLKSWGSSRKQEHIWHIADVAIKGVTEQRFVKLNGSEVVRPPSPELPSINPDRRTYFINAGADYDCDSYGA